VLVLVLLWLILAYNGLVQSRNRAQEGYSDIDVQLKRRYDLIPNLVESVKGYASHEKTVFEDVTNARSNAMQATGTDKAGAENQLSGALKSLFAVAENYPDLKAIQHQASGFPDKYLREHVWIYEDGFLRRRPQRRREAAGFRKVLKNNGAYVF
jgi:hypothetical protein